MTDRDFSAIATWEHLACAEGDLSPDTDETLREARWRDLEEHMREFAEREGWAGVLRAAANAIGATKR